MSFFEILLSLVLLEYIRINLSSLRNIILSFNWILEQRKTKDFSGPNSKRIIYLMIPVLHEVKIIKSTLEFFGGLNLSFVKIYFITTEKEIESKSNKTTTIDLIKKYLKKNPKINHIHYPYIKGDKASQINYAIDKLEIKKEDYIAIYDADSRPEIKTFYYVALDKENPEIYQQYPLYFRNFNKLSLFSKGSSFFQTKWSFSYELINSLRNYSNNAKKLNIFKNNLIYCIGHGLFIKKEFYEKVGGFVEGGLAEDLALGYYTSSRRKKIKPIPFFDNCEYAPNLKISIIQSSRWFGGETEIIKRISFDKEISNITNLLLLLKRVYRISTWLIGPIIFLGIIAFLIVTNSTIIFVEIVIFFITYSVTGYVFLRRNKSFFEEVIGEKLNYFLFYTALMMLLKGLLDFLGPLYFIKEHVSFRSQGKNIPFIKTKRI